MPDRADTRPIVVRLKLSILLRQEQNKELKTNNPYHIIVKQVLP